MAEWKTGNGVEAEGSACAKAQRHERNIHGQEVVSNLVEPSGNVWDGCVDKGVGAKPHPAATGEQ